MYGRTLGRKLALLPLFWPLMAQAQTAPAPTPERKQEIARELEEIRTMRRDIARQVDAMDARIGALEAELGVPPQPPAPVPGTPAPVAVAPQQATPPGPPPPPPLTREAARQAEAAPFLKGLGDYEFGKGLVLARGPSGELDFSVLGYARYLNQLGLDPTYTDSFGRTFNVDRRNDVQLQKVLLYFKGWMFDPNFRYLFYVWTSNSSQGLGAQVVLGGSLGYRFSDAFTLSAGIGSLPTTRSTNYNFPNWLKLDSRTIADDYFRGSYTSGVWASGTIARGLQYRVMIGNNLSQLGVDAGQLDPGFNTVSGALTWMPTTGEYGYTQGFGDYEYHKELATLLSANFTHSRENAEAQPGVNDFENSQIRLSDGTRIFQPGAFLTDGQITEATYKMFAASAGFKYRGWSVEGELYRRWVDNFETLGFIPIDRIDDWGFQLQASAMAIPEHLQVYLAGSKIYGDYGNPGDFSLGLNWYPMGRREVRINAQALYLDRSPVGYAAVPYVVGGNGWVFSTDVMLSF